MFKFMTSPPICGPYLRRLKNLRARSIDRIPYLNCKTKQAVFLAQHSGGKEDLNSERKRYFIVVLNWTDADLFTFLQTD